MEISFIRWAWTCNFGTPPLIDLHLNHALLSSSIYELERLAQVPNKFQFPLFETFHWYAAKSFYEELRGTRLNSPHRHCKRIAV